MTATMNGMASQVGLNLMFCRVMQDSCRMPSARLLKDGSLKFMKVDTIRWNSIIDRQLVSGIGANTFSLIVASVIQLGLVPIMTKSWGPDRYGLWVLLFTIPSYLALSDIGFATAAGTRMTMETAVQDRLAANRTFQSALITIIFTSAVFLILSTSIIMMVPAAVLKAPSESTQTVRHAVYLLAFFGLACLQGSLLQAGFKSAGLFALGTWLSALSILSEGLTAAIMVTLGCDVAELAFCYVINRSFFIALQSLVLRRKVPWLKFGFKEANWTTIRSLARPAFAVTALPIAQALFLQGTTLVVGLAVSAAAVATFASVRTLTRAAIQLTTLINHAIMPRAAVALSRNEKHELQKIVRLTMWGSLIALLPCAAIFLIGGTEIVKIWTGGVLHPSFALMSTMTAIMVANGIWHPMSNLLLAVNRQESYSYVYVGAVFVAVVVAYPLCLLFGEVGAALSLLLLDVFMLQHTLRLIRRIFFDAPLGSANHQYFGSGI
jgi:O-antigen/teichoic acid export membrane protein